MRTCLAYVLTAAAAAAAPPRTSPHILPSATAAFKWARENLVHPSPGNNEGACGWTRSTYAAGVWAYYAATGDSDARDDLVRWGEQLNYSLCTTTGIWTTPCAFNTTASCADNQLCAGTYIELYTAGLDLPAPRSLHTLRAITDELQHEIAAGSVADGSWVKVDLTYMGMAPLSRLGAVTGDAAYFEKQWNNFNATMLAPLRPAAAGRPATFNLFNLTDRLFYQRPQLVGTDQYWGRGNGWAMLGLIDALRFGDAAAVTGGVADAHRGDYIRIFQLFAARLLGLQGGDGAWRSSLLHPELFPQPETSGTASLTAGLAYGVSAGLLDRQTFAPAVRQAWDFLSKTALNSTGYLGHCQPNGGGPSTAPFANATTDYCVGMFLMAAVEVAAMGPGEPALV